MEYWYWCLLYSRRKKKKNSRATCFIQLQSSCTIIAFVSRANLNRREPKLFNNSRTNAFHFSIYFRNVVCFKGPLKTAFLIKHKANPSHDTCSFIPYKTQNVLFATVSATLYQFICHTCSWRCTQFTFSLSHNTSYGSRSMPSAVFYIPNRFDSLHIKSSCVSLTQTSLQLLLDSNIQTVFSDVVHL